MLVYLIEKMRGERVHSTRITGTIEQAKAYVSSCQGAGWNGCPDSSQPQVPWVRMRKVEMNEEEAAIRGVLTSFRRIVQDRQNQTSPWTAPTGGYYHTINRVQYVTTDGSNWQTG